jgi:hypothetical protein
MVGTGIFDIFARRFTPGTGLKYPLVTSPYWQFDDCQWSHWMLNVWLKAAAWTAMLRCLVGLPVSVDE